jgi:hypothetical protein
MFGQVLDKLDAWFGRSFLLASYFPWLIFAAANVVMAQLMTPELVSWAVSPFSASAYANISGVLVALTAIAGLAYVTDPLIRPMTNFLEGVYFPRIVRQWLATEQSRIARDLAAKESAAGEERVNIAKVYERLPKEIEEARRRGVAIRAVADRKLVRAARAAMAPLLRLESRQAEIASAALFKGIDAVKAALARNCSDTDRLEILNAKQKQWEQDQCRALNDLYEASLRLIEYAYVKWRGGQEGAVAERQSQLPASNISATRFGNEAAALSSRFYDRLQLDFELFWPMMQLVLQSDQKVSDSVLGAKQQLEFCIRIFWLTILFAAIWFVVAALRSPWLYATPAIGTAGFAAAALWLEIVYGSYRSFAEQVFAVVALKRFELLEKLRLPLPVTWAEEKTVWKNASAQLRWGAQTVEITYHHPDKGK